MAFITNRQQEFILTLYKRIDEINVKIDKLEPFDTQRIKLIGAGEEMMRLADRVKRQWQQEAQLLESVKQQITDEPIPSITPEEEYATNA